MFVLLFLACGAPAHTWLPTTLDRTVRLVAPVCTEAAILYVDEAGTDAVADLALRVGKDGTWSLARSAAGEGLYDVPVADGRLGPDGEVVGLPAGLWAQATGFWQWSPGCTESVFAIGAERVPGA